MAAGSNVGLRVGRHPQAEAAVRAHARTCVYSIDGARSPRPEPRTGAVRSLAPPHDARLAAIHSLALRPLRRDSAHGGASDQRPCLGTVGLGQYPERRDFAEIATILASDIADLRAALELGNPFETAFGRYTQRAETLVVTRTMTAAKALLDSSVAPIVDRAARLPSSRSAVSTVRAPGRAPL